MGGTPIFTGRIAILVDDIRQQIDDIKNGLGGSIDEVARRAEKIHLEFIRAAEDSGEVSDELKKQRRIFEDLLLEAQHLHDIEKQRLAEERKLTKELEKQTKEKEKQAERDKRAAQQAQKTAVLNRLNTVAAAAVAVDETLTGLNDIIEEIQNDDTIGESIAGKTTEALVNNADTVGKGLGTAIGAAFGLAGGPIGVAIGGTAGGLIGKAVGSVLQQFQRLVGLASEAGRKLGDQFSIAGDGRLAAAQDQELEERIRIAQADQRLRVNIENHAKNVLEAQKEQLDAIKQLTRTQKDLAEQASLQESQFRNRSGGGDNFDELQGIAANVAAERSQNDIEDLTSIQQERVRLTSQLRDQDLAYRDQREKALELETKLSKLKQEELELENSIKEEQQRALKEITERADTLRNIGVSTDNQGRIIQEGIERERVFGGPVNAGRVSEFVGQAQQGELTAGQAIRAAEEFQILDKVAAELGTSAEELKKAAEAARDGTDIDKALADRITNASFGALNIDETSRLQTDQGQATQDAATAQKETIRKTEEQIRIQEELKQTQEKEVIESQRGVEKQLSVLDDLRDLLQETQDNELPGLRSLEEAARSFQQAGIGDETQVQRDQLEQQKETVETARATLKQDRRNAAATQKNLVSLRREVVNLNKVGTVREGN